MSEHTLQTMGQLVERLAAEINALKSEVMQFKHRLTRLEARVDQLSEPWRS